ncbi:glycosyltransferase [Aurantibacter aestuarii]|uniref:Glycosyl transferase family 1 n=1 Tax=Aurantibacter aestuarii TaxID=1266046 RepID=A0A2T1N4Q6_9FLAO|nr:glycosyltransferase [Aurantibacter aestuarii]PSG86084.1 glycosyl transferase family 1 [Aurantibacter aestuarii]
MKILLFGEYSGFFNQLKNGLLKNNCEVTLAARQDGFKNYDVDINLEGSFWRKNPFNYIRQGIFKLTSYDIVGLSIYYNFWKIKSKFTHFDVVLLINPFPLQTHPKLERQILKFIFKNNKKVYLAACGDDYQYINYLNKSQLPYTILDAYKKNSTLKSYFLDSIKYTKKAHKNLHEFVINNCKGVIAADIDYDMAYKNSKKYLGYIPFPVTLEKLELTPQKSHDRIIIFHGINRLNYYKKGNHYFDEALKIIKLKYPEKVIILRTENVSYTEYINSYNKAHIVLDQVYSYSQGYNALESMAKGKLVFSGAEKEWLEYFNVEADTLLINAKPDIDYLVEKLDYFIQHPEKIVEIATNARAFVEKQHQDKAIALKYLQCFN